MITNLRQVMCCCCWLGLGGMPGDDTWKGYFG